MSFTFILLLENVVENPYLKGITFIDLDVFFLSSGGHVLE